PKTQTSLSSKGAPDPLLIGMEIPEKNMFPHLLDQESGFATDDRLTLPLYRRQFCKAPPERKVYLEYFPIQESLDPLPKPKKLFAGLIRLNWPEKRIPLS